MKKFIAIAFALVCVLGLASCGITVGGNDKSFRLRNESESSLEGIDTLRIEYEIGAIKFLQAKDANITIKEKATSWYRAPFYAKFTQEGSTLVLKQGKLESAGVKNNSIGVKNNSRIEVEVYLPLGFAGEVEIACDVGVVEVHHDFEFAALRINTDVGAVSIKKLAIPELTITTDVGAIEIVFPSDFSFTYDIQTEVGAVDSRIVRKGSGTVGDNPTAKVTLETNVGAISIEN